MKKNIFSLAFLILLSVTVFISCSKDDDNGDGTVTPTIMFKVAPGYVSTDVLLSSGEWFKSGIIALSNRNNKSSLDRIEVYSSVSDSLVLEQSIIFTPETNIQGYEKEWGFHATTKGGTQKWEFKVVDRNGMSNSLKFNVITPSDSAKVY